jgi:hypothetical protein
LGLATLALSIAHASTAEAALINGVTATTNLSVGFGNINNIVNGSGLPGNTPSLTGTHAVSTNSNAWFGSLSTGDQITFNLNGTYDLAGFSLWNYQVNNTIGINRAFILTSTDGTNFTPLAGPPASFAIGANFAPESPEQFNFTPVTASSVRFQVLSNYSGGITAGLSEVQFNSADPATSVPEPLTIFGTLTAVGGGAALKRRLKGIELKSE